MTIYNNPFTGSKLKVKEFHLEHEISMDDLNASSKKEDENERFILFKNGTLIRKTINEKKYFPNSFSN